eukprot:5133803-Amphidinium_carterae.1
MAFDMTNIILLASLEEYNNDHKSLMVLLRGLTVRPAITTTGPTPSTQDAKANNGQLYRFKHTHAEENDVKQASNHHFLALRFAIIMSRGTHVTMCTICRFKTWFSSG